MSTTTAFLPSASESPRSINRGSPGSAAEVWAAGCPAGSVLLSRPLLGRSEPDAAPSLSDTPLSPAGAPGGAVGDDSRGAAEQGLRRDKNPRGELPGVREHLHPRLRAKEAGAAVTGDSGCGSSGRGWAEPAEWADVRELIWGHAFPSAGWRPRAAMSARVKRVGRSRTPAWSVDTSGRSSKHDSRPAQEGSNALSRIAGRDLLARLQ